mmetsp:Transcript_37494/g.118237  ORF Transcript_37494/g.118237 Transcript_37494/m.118237 type:complete len:244 (+) Transcript_37494:940-1671(+)
MVEATRGGPGRVRDHGQRRGGEVRGRHERLQAGQGAGGGEGEGGRAHGVRAAAGEAHGGGEEDAAAEEQGGEGSKEGRVGARRGGGRHGGRAAPNGPAHRRGLWGGPRSARPCGARRPPGRPGPADLRGLGAGVPLGSRHVGCQGGSGLGDQQLRGVLPARGRNVRRGEGARGGRRAARCDGGLEGLRHRGARSQGCEEVPTVMIVIAPPQGAHEIRRGGGTNKLIGGEVRYALSCRAGGTCM